MRAGIHSGSCCFCTICYKWPLTERADNCINRATGTRRTGSALADLTKQSNRVTIVDWAQMFRRSARVAKGGGL